MEFLEKYVIWKLLRIRNESVGALKNTRMSACISEYSILNIHIMEEGCFTNPESASEYILELFIFFFLIYSLL